MNVVQSYCELAHACRWRSGESFARYHRALFAKIDFRNRRVLDVGGGVGACSFWAALAGAKEVVCLEPEDAGATVGASVRFSELALRFGLTNVRLENVTLQDFEAASATYDVIIMNNSINHLDEEACIALRTSDAARRRYRGIFERVAELARSRADLVIADCSPNNLFPRLGLKHPISKSIEWHKHQPPDVWVEQLIPVGFERPNLHWTSYARLGRLGWMLTANRLAASVLTGHFILRMKRR